MDLNIINDLLGDIRQRMSDYIHADSSNDFPGVKDTERRRSEFKHGELAGAAACYLLLSLRPGNEDVKNRALLTATQIWPVGQSYQKKFSNPIQMVREAIVLLIAELDRLKHQEAQSTFQSEVFTESVNPDVFFGQAIEDILKDQGEDLHKYLDAYVEVVMDRKNVPSISSMMGQIKRLYPFRAEILALAEEKRDEDKRLASRQQVLNDKWDDLMSKAFPIPRTHSTIPGGILPGIRVGDGNPSYPWPQPRNSGAADPTA
jgi:hypothetical protein